MLIQIQIFFGVAWSKLGGAVLPWDSRIGSISEMNQWNKLIFCMLVHIQES